MAAKNNDILVDKSTVAYEVIEKRVEAVWSSIDSIDAKTNIILGFASLIIVLLAGFCAWESKELPLVSILLFSFALVTYVLLTILGLISYRVRQWSYRPDPKTLIEHCKNEEYGIAEIKQWVAEECMRTLDKNLEGLKKKSRLTNWMLYAFVIETILLISGLFVALPI